MNNISEAKWPGWETTALLGRGSFGAVYEIHRDVLGEIEKSALKVISIPKDANDIEELYSEGFDDESISEKYEEHLKSIIAEYTMMRKMSDCVNVVNCDDIRYEKHENGIGWNIYIKMELLTPLLKALNDGFSEKEIIQLGKDICKALCACQKLNIIHRDIKPQNIFLSENGDYKLGDFGIAKAIEKTAYGTHAGTEKYMAPEVYSNKPYGATSDIYSLGLVLYWLLNNRRLPFLPSDNQKITFTMDEEAKKRRLSGEKIPAPANGSAELKEIVLKACAFKPENRYSHAEEMLSALNNIANQPKSSKTRASAAEKNRDSANEFFNDFIKNNGNAKKIKTPLYFDDELTNMFFEYILKEFKAINNIDLHNDQIAHKRITEAIRKNLPRLRNGDRIKLLLPNITVTSKGPLHLETIISLDKIENNKNNYLTMSNRDLVTSADNGDSNAKLELCCRYCIKMHEKATGINLTNDAYLVKELNKILSEHKNGICSSTLIFLRAKLSSKNNGTQNIAVDFFWQNARDYMMRLELSLNNSDIKAIVDDEINNSEIMFSKGNFSNTVYHCLVALAYNDKLPETWNLLGRSYKELKYYNSAVQCYLNAIKFAPADSKLYNNAAIAYMLQDDLANARAYAKKATAKAKANTPAYASSLATLAHIEAKAGNKVTAEKYFNKAKLANYANIEGLRKLIDSYPTGNTNPQKGSAEKKKADPVMICLYILLALCIIMIPTVPEYGIGGTAIMLTITIIVAKSRKRR